MWQKVFGTGTFSIVIVGIMLVAIVPAARQLPLIELQDDLATWLSKDDEHARALQQLESYFPAEDRILVSWDTSSLSEVPASYRTADFLRRISAGPVHSTCWFTSARPTVRKNSFLSVWR